MKTRTDFVSNSSSCSFVIAIPNEEKYKIADFIKDVVADCATSPDDEDPEFVEKLNAFNTRNLDYHLNSSELLYLGTLKLDDRNYTVNRPNKDDKDYEGDESSYAYDLNMFNRLQKDIKKPNFGKDTGEKLVEATDDAITVSYPVYASSVAVPSMDMHDITLHYTWNDNENSTPEEKKRAYDSIMRIMKTIKDPNDSEIYHFVNTKTYFISKNTIWNTRALLENGAELTFDKWEKLDELEKRLDEGQRLFVIRQNNGGDGWDNDAVYALGGWDCKFGEKAEVEVIYSECM